jgi:hypothetical protein
VLYEDLLVFRAEGLRLEGFYVRLTNASGTQTSACSATKIEKWRNMGWHTVTRLED